MIIQGVNEGKEFLHVLSMKGNILLEKKKDLNSLKDLLFFREGAFLNLLPISQAQESLKYHQCFSSQLQKIFNCIT